MWTEDDRRVAVGLACIPELKGRWEWIRPFLDHPSRLLRDAGARRALPFPVQERLRQRQWLDAADRAMEVSVRRDYCVIGFGDPAYPEILRTISDPPPVLWVEGEFAFSGEPTLAVVGSRRGTGYGRNALEFLLEPFAASPLLVISGMAQGIDTYAHRWALEHDCRTMAVVGHGLNTTYPRTHGSLRRAIVDHGGAILSEFPPTSPPRPEHFPLRNRIISGLADVVLVVEAPVRSGALNTARWALDQGREVLSVPGSIFKETSAGTNFLIRRGLAAPALVPEDVLQAFPEWKRSALKHVTDRRRGNVLQRPSENPLRNRLLKLLSPDEARPIEELLEYCLSEEWSADRVFQELLSLELEGRVISLPGRQYLLKV